MRTSWQKYLVSLPVLSLVLLAVFIVGEVDKNIALAETEAYAAEGNPLSVRQSFRDQLAIFLDGNEIHLQNIPHRLNGIFAQTGFTLIGVTQDEEEWLWSYRLLVCTLNFLGSYCLDIHQDLD